MAIYIEIRTDVRVKEIIRHLVEIDGLVLIGETDSVNYGEGFDFLYKNIPIRLFDDERTDDVFADDKFQTKQEMYEEVFSRIVVANRGQTTLRIEVDRLDENMNLQTEVVTLMKEKLKTKNYNIA